MCIFSTTQLADDTELFVDYWDMYDIDVRRCPEWMTVPRSPLDALHFIKKGYESDVALLTNRALDAFVPAEARAKADIEKAVARELQQSGELTTAIICESID